MRDEPLTPFMPGWLPTGVLSTEGPIVGRAEDLYREEAALVARAVALRRNEFATGRLQARALLDLLGCRPGPLLRHTDHSPRWPAGVIGTITHTQGLCGVALTLSGGPVIGVGIDVERDVALEVRAAEYVLTESEQHSIAGLPDPPSRARQATIAFCVKEAIYKCCHPVGNAGLSFADVELLLPATPSAIGVRPGQKLERRIPRGVELACGFTVGGGFVRAAAVLRRIEVSPGP